MFRRTTCVGGCGVVLDRLGWVVSVWLRLVGGGGECTRAACIARSSAGVINIIKAGKPALSHLHGAAAGHHGGGPQGAAGARQELAGSEHRVPVLWWCGVVWR
jgi:hypothetical protein